MKIQNWPTLLIEEYNKRRKIPMQWGTSDCVKWADRCVEVQTGKSVLLPGIEWDSERSALEAMIKYTGGGHSNYGELLRDSVGKVLEETGRPVRGDIVMINTGQLPALAVCFGDVLVAQGEEGLVKIPEWQDLVVCAWRVE